MFKIDFDISGSKKKLINPEDLLPKTVENTRGELIPFDANKIVDSLVKETSLDHKRAVEVTRNVLRKLGGLGLEFIAAPHLRELVCGELTALGLHQYRNHYTRLGIPIYDVKTMLEGTHERQLKGNGINSTLSYLWIASQVIEQYVHLDQLSAFARELHLTGRINIDLMEFWDEPISQVWDLRTLLMYGLPPIPIAGVAKTKPAHNALTAVSHAAKWLGLAQKEFSGGQGYDNFTTFIAPYLKGLPYKSDDPNKLDIVQVAQSFVYETNQICGSLWGQDVNAFITCTPYIPEELNSVSAVGPGGKIIGKYGDFRSEVRLFFKALAQVYGEGDAAGQPILIPKHIVKINSESFTKFSEDYIFLLDRETIPTGSTYFINNAIPLTAKELYSDTIRVPLKTDGIPVAFHPKDPSQFDYNCQLNNFGVIQSVNVNLPSAAYRAKKESTDIFTQLNLILPEIKTILLKKYEMIVKEIKAEPSKLPFCTECLNAKHLGTQCLYNMRNQFLVIGITGLKECVKILNDHSLHSSEGLQLGGQIIDYLQEFVRKISEETKLSFVLTDHVSLSAAERFAKLDLKFLGELAQLYVQESNGVKTYSIGTNLSISEKKENLLQLLNPIGELQRKIFNGTIIEIPKKLVPSSVTGMWDFCRQVIEKAQILGFRLI